MASSSSSKQSTSVTNVREDNIFSNSGVSGDVLNIGKAGGDVTVNTTDHGAVAAALEANQGIASTAFEQAFGFGNAALDANTDTVETALNANRDVISDAFSSMEWRDQQQSQQISRAFDFAQSAATSDSAETMQSAFKYTALAVAAAAGAYLISRSA
ncbi:hypothetical protein [Alloalcanivorax mobilis]|uniref:hypothetical protein n=1 Tax=Alloalcanivorax mobilis TaxID=2019569 RepID=UPI000C77EBAB|nr:hypothetical protein [Alloalcanivorax mobilis]